MSDHDEWISRAVSVGHELEREPDGDVHWFAMEGDNHNGPRCVRCEMAWCWHCVSPDKIEPCRGPRPDPPPLSRDALLAEIARSLRATHPERCEAMIAEVERRLLGDPPIANARVGWTSIHENRLTVYDAIGRALIEAAWGDTAGPNLA